MSEFRSVPLPKFGEWDVKNPGSAGEFSVIFDKARNAKKADHGKLDNNLQWKEDRDSALLNKQNKSLTKTPSNKKWLCCSGNPSYAES